MLTTALIVLVVVSAMALLSLIILKLVNNPKLAPEFSCVEWQINPPLTIQKACYNEKTQDIEILVYRSGDFTEFQTIEFIVEGTLGTKVWQCGEGCGLCSIQSRESSKTYYFNAGDIRAHNIKLSAFQCSFGQKAIVPC